MSVRNLWILWCSRETQFTESVTVKIFCGTWNVNAKKQEGGLTDWLLPKETMRDQGPADVYAIGFQEMVDLNAMNVALDSGKSQQRSTFWQQTITECLQSVGQYTIIAEKHLVGLLLVVLVKSSLHQYVKDVRTASLGVGIMGMLGNKGGVSVRLCLYDTSICFVCAHLAAHRENVAGRNSDFKNIYERTIFLTSEQAVIENASEHNSLVVRPRYGADRFIDVDVTVPDHEIIYWIGDLNYRITEDVPTDDVFYKIDTKDIAFLRPFDQLNIERARGAAFQGFIEGQLNFPPTYKFQPGTDLYERRAEKKLRAPAWCDRVLWKTAKPDAVKLLNYRCATLRPSDHKPVSALLETQLRIVVAQKEREVYSNLMNSLEHWKNDSLPVAEVSGYPIDMTNVKFNVSSKYIISPLMYVMIGVLFFSTSSRA
jgi:phosphatidylinositol-bisphosphatase